MNILSIFKKECTHNIRDIKANVLMVLFPIVLMVILGAALSPMFNTKVELDYVEVLYTDEAQAYLSTAYAEFTDQVAREMGIEFEAIDNTRGAIEQIGDSNYSAYIHLTDKQEIKLYKNEKYAFEANLIEAITRSFVEKYNVYMELATKAPDKLEAASTMEMPSLLRLRSLDRKKSAESMDYYAVTMLTLILLYSSLTGIESIKREQRLKTGHRLQISPIKKYEILTGKLLGTIVITIVQVILVYAFSKYILNAYWGDNPLLVSVIITSEAIMAVSMGIGLSFIIKSESALTGLINTIIPIMVLLGGGYVPLEVLGKTMQRLSIISPVRWTNQALLRLIYDKDLSTAFIAIGINLALALVFILLASLVYTREDV